VSGAENTEEGESLSERLGFAETIIEFGPLHPGVRHVMTSVGGSASFLVELDDDRITGLEVEIGLAHRGFEKQVESGDWAAALPYVSRLGLASGVLAETAYCLAVESLAGLALPDRAIWLRMLVGELARVSDHWSRLGATMAAIGLQEGARVAATGETRAARALAGATGVGPLEGYVKVGGVSRGLADEFAQGWPTMAVRLMDELEHFERVAVSNPTCVRRLRDVAPLGVEEALAWGVTGPALRAAGSSMDLRRDHPYLAYGALEFDVPIGENGDGLDRLLVIVEEIRQSLRMVDQCHRLLVSLGPGRVLSEAAGPGEVALARGEVVASVESSTGELAFLLSSDGTSRLRRARCRAPSFFHAQAMPVMLRGARLDDLLPTAALLHLISAEHDR
jgi:NADH:ubiquinone oxidoreductase subunit D